MKLSVGCVLWYAGALVSALQVDSREVDYNLNQNATATNPVQYFGEWANHNFHPSPSNWRFPFYTLFLDRFVNGDPSNDNANGTQFEHDISSNQFRHGGDLAGLTDTLDYMQGMGIKGIYLAGTPFLNLPWKSDGYSPLDLSVLDHHFGTIAEWRTAIDEIHSRDMYVVLDNTMSTLSNLIGFEPFLNASAPFNPAEYKAVYKTNVTYHDFSFGNTYNPNCQYPRFWNDSGNVVTAQSDANFSLLNGCYDSEFDQYGDTEAFGVFPDWQRQLSKFASVQDRLREWNPSVREKIQQFSCITISMLDIDGFRYDKATQVTVDALAEYGEFVRSCARKYNKQNFFMPGEITGGNTFGSIYLGRGREPEQVPTFDQALKLTNASNSSFFLRDQGLNALDAAAFHYSIYRSLTRFLGMDGNLTAGYDVPVNFVDTWNTMLTTNDLINANTGVFDPRHMYGTANQDVFRWPSIKNGVEKMLLGQFITTLHMPGIPLLLWGEEQADYVLDSTASNYIFGRSPISSAQAWQDHGCYRLGSSQYYKFPVEAALDGCNDDAISLDHRDPSHPVRNIIKSMYHLRSKVAMLNDGFFLQELSNQTHEIFLPGSNGTATEIGIWSVMRDHFPGDGKVITNNQSVWLVYHNENTTINYDFDCSKNDTAIISPFDTGTTVKNLLAPYDEFVLKDGPKKLGIDGSEAVNGCVEKMTLAPWAFAVYVPKASYVEPPVMITGFTPGHDARIASNDTIPIEIQFNKEMNCKSMIAGITITSKTGDSKNATLAAGSTCTKITGSASPYVGGVVSAWSFKGTLTGVSDGVHTITISNVTTEDGTATSDSKDHFFLRVGQNDNPMVFPRLANYSSAVLFKDDQTKDLFVSHKAAGADQWRYSLNWGSSWSDWATYNGGNDTLAKQPWSGTDRQKWKGDHVILQYWSRMTGSSDHIQHGDVASEKQVPRRFPHLFAQGDFNEFGFDAGLNNNFELGSDGVWKFHLSSEWPATIQVNVWGMNPDKQPDATYVFGDIDNDTILDRSLPDALAPSFVNLSNLPPSPYLAYRVDLVDSTARYTLVPVGSRLVQIIVFSLLLAIPLITAFVSTWAYIGAFYGVKFNKIGISQKKGLIPFLSRGKFEKINDRDEEDIEMKPNRLSKFRNSSTPVLPAIAINDNKRRTVLIATMEYDIEDWEIKIKIGGLGVMAQLMGKSLQHQDLIWVVPCVGGIDYPVDTVAEPMTVTILGSLYEIQVQYHTLRNITYVLLDAPIFRQQTKSEPYPPRMDDLDSAVYYSAWNACIAETIKRFPVDLYHINDYHGAAAPLYLLPKTIPCALSLHNAEFQGLWPMRSPKECEEISRVFNLDLSIVEKYVQFGEVFNLLHAAASYLRVHQKGFGAVGVSNKYGERSYARYPIFWGLKKIGKLPNPDPSDTAPWDPEEEARQVIAVDPKFEASRGDLRRQAQEWAGLEVNPNAELFVFVGRWSMQKGVDLIADVFPAVLEKNKDVQLICIGPVIDLYGKFAALKLAEIMKKYPGRVYSKPEFTTLPPYIFSGAEFALIPSRDEPFGLVAVEFGRKGALGVGARVGGLGQMPGWWFTVESTTTKHMHAQFKSAIEDALKSKTAERAMMRARSAKQRFPVAKWVADLDSIQGRAIRIHQQEASHTSEGKRLSRLSRSSFGRDRSSSGTFQDVNTERFSSYEEAEAEEVVSSDQLAQSSGGLGRSLSLGVRNGPGHRGNRLRENLIDTVEESDFGSEVGSNPNSVPGTPGEYVITREQAEASFRAEALRTLEGEQAGDLGLLRQPRGAMMADRDRSRSPSGTYLRTANDSLLPATRSRSASRTSLAPDDLEMADRGRVRPRGNSESLLPTDSLLPAVNKSLTRHRNSSILSLNEVTGDRKDFSLQKTDPTFNDTNGKYYNQFEGMLSKLDGKNSEGDLCIEEYLVDSEKEWFKRLREAKLTKSREPSPNPSGRRASGRYSIPFSEHSARNSDDNFSLAPSVEDEFLLGNNFKRDSFLKRVMQRRILDWPVYTILLALGQIIAANSYQITLLTGGKTQNTETLYIIGGIYIVTSLMWYFIFRRMKSIYVLSLPFLFYGTAFLFVGLSGFLAKGGGQDWMRNVATGMYATASSSGSIYFSLNFGDEGGAPIKSWVYRACLIQGTQQIYISALFYWGNTIARTTASGKVGGSISSTVLASITLPIAVLLWIIGLVLFTSLPSYYRQSPGKIPDFYQTLLRRRIIGWFFVTVILQNYFLSAPYGRNWGYLWSSNYAPSWAVAIEVFVFFIGIWAAFLAFFGYLSKSHSWILPIFAIGLGAPRWAQMLWGTSGLGLWLPWFPGGPVAGALAGRALWLWLGLLDSIQGVGFGMMLLQTLTRIHIAVSLIAAQVIGTAVTLIAKATAPDANGPGDVFPDFSAGVIAGISKPWFWIALGCQLVIPFGFFKFFRKEQLSKP
ncbi:putative alpha 1,3 glucan synthase [Coleophoma cylindrospora]|uniref:alpha-1,3-glucan synthase n=1 Tax=Coleophoma cylindrospora TaxID=1849047 RepID=A0A3D8S126_9HELO|nr:putative alpha 1,3 glucan synthase [Coleophoma cylindrospora]